MVSYNTYMYTTHTHTHTIELQLCRSSYPETRDQILHGETRRKAWRLQQSGLPCPGYSGRFSCDSDGHFVNSSLTNYAPQYQCNQERMNTKRGVEYLEEVGSDHVYVDIA